MPGQYKTRRNAETGQIESVPEAEQGALKAAAEGIAPPPAVRQEDIDFVNAGQESPPLPDATEPPPVPPVAPPVQPPPVPPVAPPVQPPPVPPVAPPVQPPPLPPSEDGGEEGSGVGGAVQGARMGSKFGPVGALVGAGLGFVAGRKKKPQVIGTPEGAVGGQGGDDVGGTLRQLLAVQQDIARRGSPIKNLITTQARNSRM